MRTDSKKPHGAMYERLTNAAASGRTCIGRDLPTAPIWMQHTAREAQTACLPAEQLMLRRCIS